MAQPAAVGGRRQIVALAGGVDPLRLQPANDGGAQRVIGRSTAEQRQGQETAPIAVHQPRGAAGQPNRFERRPIVLARRGRIDPIDEGARLRSKPHYQVMADRELAGQRRCMPAAVRDLRGRRHRQLATTSRLGKSQHSALLRPRDCRSRTAHVDLP